MVNFAHSKITFRGFNLQVFLYIFQTPKRLRDALKTSYSKRVGQDEIKLLEAAKIVKFKKWEGFKVSL